jgi:hypothetical protein
MPDFGAIFLPWRARLGRRLLPPRLFVLSVLPPNSVCAEIGSYKGDFAAWILSSGRPRKLHLIDPWKHETDPEYQDAWYGKADQRQMDGIYQSVQDRFRKEIASGRVTLHRKSSETAHDDFPDAYFDWIYVDGNHRYEFVAKDLRVFYPKVKPGGFICGDDYEDAGWWEGGVQRAVDEFVDQGFCEKIVVKNGQFMLKKRETSLPAPEQPQTQFRTATSRG